MASETRSEWDEMAGPYGDVLAPSFGPLYATLMGHVFEHINTQKRSSASFRVVDFGCGTGHQLVAIAQTLPHHYDMDGSQTSAADGEAEGDSSATRKRPRVAQLVELIGIDLSSEMIRRAQAQLTKPLPPFKLVFQQGDLTALSGYGAQVDVIICSLVLMYLSDEQVQEALSAFCEALAPGGLLLISVWCQRSRVFFLDLVKAAVDHFSGAPAADHDQDASFRFADPALLSQLLNDQGFSSVEIEEARVATDEVDVQKWIQDVPFISSQLPQVSQWMATFAAARDKSSTALVFKCRK